MGDEWLKYLDILNSIASSHGYTADIRNILKDVYAIVPKPAKEMMSKEECLVAYLGVYLDAKGFGTVHKGTEVNRLFKDTAFCITYSTPENAAWLLRDLCNKQYDPKDIDIITITNEYTSGKHNDLGVQVNDELFVFCEEQSTICENMPLRMLLYYDKTVQKYITDKGYNSKILRKNLVHLPNPVFYVIDTTGKASQTYELKDAFGVESPMLNLKVNVVQQRDNYKSLLPFYVTVDFIKEHKNSADMDLVRTQWQNLIASLDCPESIKKRMLERSVSIMGSIQEEVTIADMLRDEREEGIENLVLSLQKYNISKTSIISDITERYQVSIERATELVNKYYK